MFSSVSDQFYEAAVLPELWPQACEALARDVNGHTATIFAINELGHHRFVCTPNIREGIEKFVADPRLRDNVRPARALENFPFIFARELDLLSEEELQSDFVFNDHIKPAGMQWSAGCVFQEPTGHIVMFDILRRAGLDHYSDGELARLNTLKPDLARAVYLASRMAFAEARSVANTLETVGLAAAVLSDGGQVMAANEAFEALGNSIRIGPKDRLQTERSALQLLNEAVETLQKGMPPRVQSIPIAGTPDEPPLVLHVLPIRRAARDVFARILAIVVVTPVGTVGAPDSRVISGLFDLTPAEAKIARLIAGGVSVEGIAESLSLSTETVRSHLKRVMAKTGTSRQVELVRLLLGTASPFPFEP